MNARSPVLRLSTDDLVVDNFAGGGGASLGIEWALGRSPDIAVNHDPEAVAMHAANHPATRHFCESVWTVDPERVCGGRPVALAWFSPDCRHFSKAKGGKPTDKKIRGLAWVAIRWARAVKPRVIVLENVEEFCFPPETTVLSKRGVVPIGDIRTGDEVWTHNARWKPVTRVTRRVADTVRIRGVGNTIMETTGNHEFYSRRYAPRITVSGKRGRHKVRLLEPEWIRAGCLGDSEKGSTYSAQYTGYAWASPLELPRYWMRLPKIEGCDTSSPAFFYMLGRWLGAGWIRKREKSGRRNLVRICDNTEGADYLEEKLKETGLEWHRQRHTDTVDVFDLGAEASSKIIPWLRHNFREFSYGKTLPAWVFGASEVQRRALVEGWVDSDGSESDQGKVSATSVSRCLAVGFRLLLHSLGIPASISLTPPHVSRTPSGRGHMVISAAYAVNWKRTNDWEKNQRSELHYWGRVNEVLPGRTKVGVVDISVADDHSFIADGQVVHNCGWGPLTEDGLPDLAKKGFTFRRWFAQLQNCGYRVESRELRACDYGAPTTRKRLFIVARSDGLPIVWPEPTHGQGLAPYRTAAECIQWELACPSIFERERPLAENTVRRIARGIRRYVIEAAEPFIIPVSHAGDERAHSIHEPLRTVTGAHRGEQALVMPFLAEYYSATSSGSHRVGELDDPLPVQTTANRFGLVSPTLIQTSWGEREGQAPRTLDLFRPLGTVVAGGIKHALVSAFLAKHYGGHEATGSRLGDPIDTVTAVDHHSLVASHLLKLRGGLEDHQVTAQDHRRPVPAITAGGTHLAEVRAFLIKYYGCEHQDPQLGLPLHTVTTRDRFGLVTVKGQDYVIADIGMRMLAPRELFRAQGFPDSYRIDATVAGAPLSKGAQVRMCGNSVCPPVAAAVVRAQFTVRAEEVTAA